VAASIESLQAQMATLQRAEERRSEPQRQAALEQSRAASESEALARAQRDNANAQANGVAATLGGGSTGGAAIRFGLGPDFTVSLSQAATRTGGGSSVSIIDENLIQRAASGQKGTSSVIDESARSVERSANDVSFAVAGAGTGGLDFVSPSFLKGGGSAGAQAVQASSSIRSSIAADPGAALNAQANASSVAVSRALEPRE